MTVRNVKKNLAAQQDILLGIGPHSQIRNGQSVVVDGIAKSYIRLWKDFCGPSYVGTFEDGCILNEPSNKVVCLATGEAFTWSGTLPKNLPKDSTPINTGGIASGAWVQVSSRSDAQQLWELLRRSYSEAGFNLVAGSFEAGFTYTSANDVGLNLSTGKAYAYVGVSSFPVVVQAETDPSGSDYFDVSGVHFGRSITASRLGLIPGVGNGANNAIKIERAARLIDELIVDGYFEYNTNITITKPGQWFKLSGEGELKGINSFITVQGALVPLGLIVAAAAKGGRTITVVDASGINVGDTICIHNQTAFSFSAHRAEYTAGEFNTVLSKSGNQLTLASRLMFDYTGLTNVKVFKLDLLDFVLDTVNLSVEGTSVYAFRIKYANPVILNQPDIIAKQTSACAAALLFDKCPNVVFDLGLVHNDTVGSGTQYGISFSSCWNAQGFVKHAHAYRHGVTTGGDAADASIPCNNIVVGNGSVISNEPASLIYAADFHGNTINSYYKDCIIYGDIGLAGENVGCPGCTIYGARANYTIDLHEVVGGELNLDNIKIKPLSSFNFPELIGFSASSLAAKVDRPFTIKAHNISCELIAATARLFNLLYNQAAAVSDKCEIDIDGINITGTPTGLTDLVRAIQQSPGIRPDSISIKNAPRLTDAQKYIVFVGTFQGCLVSLPSSSSADISLTIAGGGWFSSTGGIGGYALYSFPHYPIPPQPVVQIVDIVRAETPKLVAYVESIGTNNITAYIATSSSGITIAGGATKNVRLTAVFERMLMP